jgi:hypothetical protein
MSYLYLGNFKMSIPMTVKTVRLPDSLVQQVEQMALVTRRSFTKMVEILLQNSIDRTIETDLELLRNMQTLSPSATSATSATSEN